MTRVLDAHPPRTTRTTRTHPAPPLEPHREQDATGTTRAGRASRSLPHLKGSTHAPLALLRHLRPPLAPDHARRHRQQHRQRQHRRLQVARPPQFQDTLSQITQGAGRPADRHRRHEPRADRPRRAGRRHLDELRAGLGAGHRQGDRPDDLGRRLLRHPPRQRHRLHPRRVRSTSTPTAVSSSSDGKIVQGYSATNGVVNDGGALGDITLPLNGAAPATATTTAANVGGNLPCESAVGDKIVRDTKVYDANGLERTLTLTFTRTTAGWDASGDRRQRAPPPPPWPSPTASRPVPRSLRLGGVTVDLSGITGFAALNTTSITEQNGRAGRHAAGLLAVEGRHADRPVQQRSIARPRSRRARDLHEPRRPREGRATRATARRPTRVPRRSAPPVRPASARSPAARSRCRTSTSRRSSPT